MDRTEFMSLVYDELQSDADNNRANRIIDAADDYAESMEPRWIPVTERLPEEGQECLVCDKGQILIDTFIGHGNPYNWRWYVRDYEAWLPLPNLYREEEKHDQNPC